MALFQLDAQSLAARARDHSRPSSLVGSITRGMFGFTIVSVAGFLPWVFGGPLFRTVGEVPMYLTCALIFIGLSGAVLHRLIMGAGSLARFYKVFGLAFTIYSAAWIACWIALRGDAGSLTGLLAGTAAMGLIFAIAFDAWHALGKIIAALFILNTAGYYIGGWIEAALISRHRVAAMLMWGVCYGFGFGAGLGTAFYLCQERARTLLSRK